MCILLLIQIGCEGFIKIKKDYDTCGKSWSFTALPIPINSALFCLRCFLNSSRETFILLSGLGFKDVFLVLLSNMVKAFALRDLGGEKTKNYVGKEKV